MELTGKVVNVLPAQSGTSNNGNEWVKNGFVIQTQGEYPRMVCFSVMGKDRWEKMNIQVGMTYNVSFDVESREWKDKWFTELTAWKAMAIGGQSAAPAPQSNAQVSNAGADEPPF